MDDASLLHGSGEGHLDAVTSSSVRIRSRERPAAGDGVVVGLVPPRDASLPRDMDAHVPAAAAVRDDDEDDADGDGEGEAAGPRWTTTTSAEVAITWVLRAVLLIAAVVRASAVSSCYMLAFVVSLSFAPTVSSPLARRGRVTRGRVWLSRAVAAVASACVLVDVLYQVLVAAAGSGNVGDAAVWRVWGVVSYAASPAGAVGLLSDLSVAVAAAAHALVVARQSREDDADNIVGRALPASAHLTGPLTTVAMILSLTLAACVQPTSFGIALFGVYVYALLWWAFGPNPSGKFGEPSFFSTGAWFRRVVHAIACTVVLGGSLFQLTPASLDVVGFYLGFVRLPGHLAGWSYYVLYVGVVVLLACTASLEQDVAREGGDGDGGGKSADLRVPLMAAVDVDSAAVDSASPGVAETDAWSRFSRRLTRRVLHIFSGPFGFFLVGLSSLAWATTYPSLLALPVLLWPIVMLHRYSPSVDYRVPSRTVRVLLWYMTLLTLIQHVMYVCTNFAYPSELLAALQGNDWYDDGYGSSAVKAWVTTPWRLLGLTPITRPVRRLGLQIALMWVTAVYYKATRTRSGGGAAGAGSGSTGERAAAAAAAHPSSRTAVVLEALSMSLTVLAYDFAWVWALVVLYVMGLSRVDGLHAVFMFFFLCFFVSPRLRERHWNKLVWYTEVNLVVLFLIFVLDTTVPWDATGWPTTVGLVLNGDVSELRSSSYLSDIAIYVFSGMQFVHYQRHVTTDMKRALFDRFRGIASLTRQLQRLQAQYGVWLCYGAFLVIALIPPVEWRKAASILLVLLIMQAHFAVGVAAGSTSRVVVRLLAFFGIFEACVAAARYLFQFDAIQTALAAASLRGTVESFGIRRVAADVSLYAYLLDSIVMVVLSSVQVRTMIKSAEAGRLGRLDTQSWQRDVATFSEWTRGAGDPGLLGAIGRGVLWTLGRAQFVWRYTLFHNSAKITLLLGFVAACVHASVGGAVYALLAVLYGLRPVFSGTRCIPLRWFAADAGTRQPYDTCWLPFQLLASAYLIAKYAFQLDIFGSGTGRWYAGGSAGAQWWGMYRVAEYVTVSGDPHGPVPPVVAYHTAQVTFGGLIALVAPELAILLSVALQRWASSFKARLQHEARSRRLLATPQSADRETKDAEQPRLDAPTAAGALGDGGGTPVGHGLLLASPLAAGARDVGLLEGFYRGFRRYKSLIVLDVAIFLFTVTACVHTDVWSMAQLAGVSLFVLPAYSRRMEKRQWWGIITCCQAIITLGKYAALTDFPPSFSARTSTLPFSLTPPYKYYFGFGPGPTTWQLVSDFVALLACGVVAQTWSSHARRTRELRAGHIIIGDDGVAPHMSTAPVAAASPHEVIDVLEVSDSDEDVAGEHPLVVRRRRHAWCGIKCCTEKIRYQRRGVEPMDAGDFTYDDDGRSLTVFKALQFAFYTLSIKAVLIVLFAMVAFQQATDIFSAGYLVFATYYLLSSDKLVIDGNSMLHYLRVYNFGVMIAQLTFQCPWFSWLECDATASASCLSVLQLIGLQKYSTVTVDGANPCTAGFSGSNADCPSPFSLRQGMIPTLVMFILSYVFDSPSYVYVRAYYDRERTSARSRREKAEQLAQDERQKQRKKANEMRQQLRQQLRSIAAKAAKWEALLVSTTGSHEVASMLVPPMPPRVEAWVEVGEDGPVVRVRWTASAAAAAAAAAAAERGHADGRDGTILRSAQLRYQVAYKLTDSPALFGDIVMLPPVPGDPHEATISTLLPGRRYAIQVRAIGEAGAGLFSDAVLVQVAAGGDGAAGGEDGGGDAVEPDGAPQVEAAVSTAEAPRVPRTQRLGALWGRVSAAALAVLGWLERQMMPWVDVTIFHDMAAAHVPGNGADDEVTLLVASTTDAAEAHRSPAVVARGLAVLLYRVVLSNTRAVLVFAFIMNHIMYASLISSVFAVGLFCYVQLEHHRPPKSCWQFFMVYTVCVMIAKFVFNMSLFCFRTDASSDILAYSSYPWCDDVNAAKYADALADVQPVLLIGIYKVTAAYGGAGFVSSVAWDLFVLLALLLHKFSLQRKGWWTNAVGIELAPPPPPGGIESAARAISAPSKRASRFLARLGVERNVESRARRAVFAIADYYDRLCEPAGSAESSRSGRDLYLETAIVQMVMLLGIIIGYASISNPTPSGSNSNSIGDQLSGNQFSGSMVLTAIAQITIMILDRVAYLQRSAYLKLVVQYCTVAFVHVMFFFVIPLQSDVTFSDNGAAIISYIICCIYFEVGGLQLHFGFPDAPPRHSLTSNGFKFPYSILFPLFQAIPFLDEMRIILDWICARTSLDMFMWIKLEWIRGDLFRIQCYNTANAADQETLSGRRPQQCIWKFLNGTLTFIGLLVVLLGPALLFSSLNPTMTPNPVSGAEVTLDNTGVYVLFDTVHFRSLSTVSDSGEFSTLQQVSRVGSRASDLKYDMMPLTQRLELLPYPTVNWDISPPAAEDLLEKLANCSHGLLVLNVELNVAFHRPGPTGYEVISQAATLALSTSSCAIMHHNVLNAFNSSSPVTFEPVTIAQVYPAVIRLPATGAPVALSPEKFWRSISLNLHRDISSDPALRTAAGSSADQSAQLWWQIEISDSIIANEQGDGMVFYVTSDRVAPSYLTGGIGSYSVMAVYVTVVLAVGRLVRSGLGSPTHRIIFEDMPDVTDLVELTEGIQAARCSAYQGNLKDEVRLYDILIRLYRSPEVLLQMTKAKIE